MTALCVYRENVAQACAEPATHQLEISRYGNTVRWFHGPTIANVFCADHAALVAQHLQERWDEAAAVPRGQVLKQPCCAVCQTVLEGVASQVAGVGKVCGACHAAAGSEAMLAYQGGTKTRKRTKPAGVLPAPRERL